MVEDLDTQIDKYGKDTFELTAEGKVSLFPVNENMVM
jgi:hypothetical protein